MRNKTDVLKTFVNDVVDFLDELSSTGGTAVSDSIRPLGDRVLVRRAPEETKVGSILLPDQAKEKPRRGKVLRLGKCRKTIHNRTPAATAEGLEYRVSFQVDVGDTVYFNRYGGIEVPAELGEGLLLISEAEILAYTRG